LELGAAYACAASKDEKIARTVIGRTIEFLIVEKDVIRTESCNMLGLCVRHLVESCKPAASILKKKGKNGDAADNKSKKTNDTVAGWKLECLLDIGKAIQPRITDKIAKVRSAAISACLHFYVSDNTTAKSAGFTTSNNKNYEKMITSIQTTLMWIMSNDSSAPNRALVAQIIGRRVSGEEKETLIPCIIERVKDVDVKVREAALDSLRENVTMDNLTEDQRVEILRYGLTKRYVSPFCHMY
jgi:hypothetical protein